MPVRRVHCTYLCVVVCGFVFVSVFVLFVVAVLLGRQGGGGVTLEIEMLRTEFLLFNEAWSDEEHST